MGATLANSLALRIPDFARINGAIGITLFLGRGPGLTDDDIGGLFASDINVSDDEVAGDFREDRRIDDSQTLYIADAKVRGRNGN